MERRVYNATEPTRPDRRRTKRPGQVKLGGDYFPDRPQLFIRSGCSVLDCVLGGGWALGRVVNIVGDKAVGKTLLAIEACANFAREYPKGFIFYREAEAAFDEHYGVKLGLPVARVDFGEDGLGTHWDTIEDIFEDLRAQVKLCRKHRAPALYIIDSLDSLTSRAALARKVGQGSYNLEKQNILAQMLSELVRDFRDVNMCVMVISQVRDRIGQFIVGDRFRRAGGHSLDHHATQIVWLSHLKNVVQNEEGIKRTVGIRVRAHCKKNKIGLSMRPCDFVIRYLYGVMDIESSVDWLTTHKMLGELGLTANGVDAYLNKTDQLEPEAYRERSERVRESLLAAWDKVETKFLPTRSKYG